MKKRFFLTQMALLVITLSAQNLYAAQTKLNATKKDLFKPKVIKPKKENKPVITTESIIESQINADYDTCSKLLNLLKPEAKFKTKKNVTLNATLSTIVAISAGALLKKILGKINKGSSFNTASYLIGIPVYLVAHHLCEKHLSNLVQVTYTNFVKSIIKNWELYKIYIPEEFHDKFQPLLEKYNQNQKVEISESDACNLLIDLISCLKLKMKSLEELKHLSLR